VSTDHQKGHFKGIHLRKILIDLKIFHVFLITYKSTKINQILVQNVYTMHIIPHMLL